MKIPLPATTKRQNTSHQIHTTKHHKFTLRLNPPSLQNKTTDVVIQQHSRKLPIMDILMSETCWAHKKWNKTARDIKLVFYSSAFTMMHGPININNTAGLANLHINRTWRTHQLIKVQICFYFSQYSNELHVNNIIALRCTISVIKARTNFHNITCDTRTQRRLLPRTTDLQ